MVNATLAWHFLADDGKMRGRKTIVKAGEIYRVNPPLTLCEVGLHASVRPLDALQYAPGSLLCRVEVSGEIVHGDDKLCASERRVLWMADATRTLHEFSTWAVEWILDKLEATGRYKIDPRSRAAVEAKRRWLEGEISDKELDAAGLAAWAAARDAARDAAWDAARAAAWGAAWDAAWDEMNAKLEEMLLAPARVP